MPATKKAKQESDDLRREYDFTGGVRGKYATRFARGTNVVVLAPDVADVFKTSKAVNAALRSQLKRKPARKSRRPNRR
jgi:hypothetical protein